MVERIAENVYRVSNENCGKPYTLNLANKQIIGKSGRVLVNRPNESYFAYVQNDNTNALYFVQACMDYIYNGAPFGFVAIAEKIMNLNLDYECYPRTIQCSQIEWLEEKANWKKVVKYLANTHDNTNLREIIARIQQYDRIAEKHISQEEFDILSAYLRANDFDTFTTHELKMLVNIISHPEDILCQTFGINRCVDIVISTFREANAEHIAIPTGTNWLVICHNARNEAERVKMAREAEARKAEEKIVRAMQTSINLDFEDENFKIVVPITYADFAQEGKALHNCLGGYEWNNHLKNGRRRVAFVRRKSALDTPYIALDIDTSDNQIKQFLTRNNSMVTTEKALAFKEDYQTYLNSLPIIRRSDLEIE